jgi:hypothetical protein
MHSYALLKAQYVLLQMNEMRRNDEKPEYKCLYNNYRFFARSAFTSATVTADALLPKLLRT